MRGPSASSRAGLDATNFFLADVQDGVGPYLTVYLASARHWQAGPIGVAMAMTGLATALCQIPAGLMVDSIRYKRALVAISAVITALSCILIIAVPGMAPVLAAQIMMGAAAAVIPPALAAISLGLVGRRRLPGRISRNQGINHFGSFASAALAGLCGQYWGLNWIFYLVCGSALASALALLLIRPGEIDQKVARGSEDDSNDPPVSIGSLVSQRPVWVFLCSIVLFHLGNAAMLPFAGQVMAKSHPGSETVTLSACVIVAQFVMMLVAWGVGRAMARGIGRKPIFLLAYAILPIRGLLFTWFDAPGAIIAIQVLDGIAAGIFGVIAIIIAADLTHGTGRFNFLQGMVALSVGIGGGLSNLIGGYIVQLEGYHAGFLSLTVIAVMALVFFLTLMPETRDPDEQGVPAAVAA
ncbi:MFS transporter [Asaia bogorensis]|uniref:MFS transporter n=1 Tax=Asaia bogorensis TaxID=91915 RepID=UPI00285F3B09|nr:MFS transporter [Asaia bogorensis]MDR6181436.1 putative MFS family arabinose efflux permease [Asaia bogorensis NBRC 16594]